MLSKEELIGAILRADEDTIKRISDVLEGTPRDEPVLTTKQFAASLGIGLYTAYKMIYQKEVRRICYRGRVYRIPRSEVLRLKEKFTA